MATIRQRKGKFGVTYRAEVCVRGQRRSSIFDTKSAAHAWAEETEHLLCTGQPLPGELPPGDMELATAVDKYLAVVAPRKKQSTKVLDQEIATRLLRHLGHKTLRQLQREDLAAYRDLRLQKVGPSSAFVGYPGFFLPALPVPTGPAGMGPV